MKHYSEQPTRKPHQGRQDERGTALIIAVTMLFLFVSLGAAYMKYGFIEIDETNYNAREARARQLAEAGVQAALGRIHTALSAGDVVPALGSTTFDFPNYRAARNQELPTLEVLPNADASVEVFITDESGKVNVNHAPASVLQRVLEVDGATARAITANLPRTDGAGTPNARWLLSLDELVSRKLLTQEQFDALKLSRVTTLTVTNRQAPEPHFSVNTADPEVLAAVLAIPLEQAQQVKAKGPYNSLEALAQAAGKPVESLAPSETLGSFLMQPNTFQIVSTATYSTRGSTAKARVEAVIRIRDGGYETLSWRESRPVTHEAVEPQEEVQPVPETPAEAPEAEEAPATEPPAAETVS